MYTTNHKIGEIGNCEWCGKEYFVKTCFHANCSKKCGQKSAKRYMKIYHNTAYLKMRWQVLERDNFTCQYCGRNVKEDKIKLHVDHIHPFSKGGVWHIDNLTTACFECNEGKGDVILNKRK